MDDLAAELERARDLDLAVLADAVESIGFECTRCGACCRGHGDEHTATVFPAEVRDIGAVGTAADGVGTDDVGGAADADEVGGDGDAGDDGPTAAVGDGREHDASDRVAYDWRDVARPMPFGLERGPDGERTGETFEWALQTDACGDCTFYDDGEADAPGTCTVYDDRPLICRTYPFSVDLGGSEPMGEVVDREGPVRAHECEGLGREIDRADAEALARTLKERAIREVEEMISVREHYEPADPGPGDVVVHDSEGAKEPDGTPYRPVDPQGRDGG